MGGEVKVAYVEHTETDKLSDLVLNLINTRHIVVIRNFPSDKHLMAELLWKIGHPIYVNDTEFHPNIEVMKNIDDGKWYNESKAWPLHIDGLMSHVDGTHQWLPMTVLYANKLDQVRGGSTYFYDMVEGYESLGERARELFKDVKAAFQHPTSVSSPMVRDVPFIRKDKYWVRDFPLWDRWFFRFIENDQGNELTKHVDHWMVDFYGEKFRYDHTWSEGDMVIWTNEGFVHGRTAITEGNREMWRAVVRDNERSKGRFYPPEPK